MQLKRLATTSGITIGGLFANHAIRFGSNLVLARLLEPEVFGVMAITLTFITALNLFSDLGIRQLIVQSQQSIEPDFRSTVWTAQIFRGLAITALGLLLAVLAGLAGPLAGKLSNDNVYTNSQLPAVLAVVSLIGIIGGFESLKQHLLARRMQVFPVIAAETLSQLIGSGAAIASAFYLDLGVWSLVAGALLGTLSRTALSHLVLPGPRDRLGWVHGHWLEVWHFGKWITASSLIGFFISNLERIVLSVLLDATTFAMYSIANLMITVATESLGRLANNIALPVLSEHARQSPETLKDAYYRLRVYVDPLFWFLAGFLFASGSAIVSFLYDSRYAESGTILSVLALSLLPVSRGVITGQAYIAKGASWALLASSTTYLAILVVSLVTFVQLWGPFGAIWATPVTLLVNSMTVGLYVQHRLGLLDPVKEIRFLIFPVLGYAVGMFL